MRRTFKNFLSRAWYYRNRGKIIGLSAGIIGMLAMGAFASVVSTGTPIDRGPRLPVQVYSNF